MLDKSLGFTLIELMITIGIFGIVMLVGSSFLIQIIRNSNQAVTQNEVRQNAGKILLDITAEARKAYCIYYEAPAAAPPNSQTSFLTISDDPNGTKCASGNQVRYDQNGSGVITKTVTSTSGQQTSGQLSSNNVAVLDCSFGGTACGKVNSCTAGILATLPSGYSSWPVTNGVPVTVTVRAQQLLGQTRSDYCAFVTLSDTITPRIK